MSSGLTDKSMGASLSEEVSAPGEAEIVSIVCMPSENENNSMSSNLSVPSRELVIVTMPELSIEFTV